MQVTETLSEGLKREYKIVLPAGDLAARLNGQLTEMKSKARINGFRPGKVPLSHLKRLYGRSVMLDVVQDAVYEANQKIVEENKLKIAGQPRFDLPTEQAEVEKAFESSGDFSFGVTYELLPKFELGSFDDIEIERLVAEVTEDEIDQIVGRLADQNRNFVPKEAEGATAEKGDKATVDFIGKLDGVAFDGGAGTDVDVVIGSQSFIPGFEDQITGMKAGEAKTISCTFPENYSAAQLAGKDATFDVTMKSIAAPGELKIDDDFAKSFGFEDLAGLRTSVRDRINEENANAARSKWKRALLDALDKKYAFDLPPGMLEREFATIWQQAETERQQAGRSFEDEKTTEEEARADYMRIAARRVRLGLVLAEIGEKAGVTVSEEEVSRALLERTRNYPGQEKAIWDFYRKNPGALNEIRAPLFEEKVVDYLMTQVKVADKKVTRDDLVKMAAEEPEDAAETPAS
ncbi:trigger factor [Methyloferula stellata]|uniref:trigger factor n=1 Tax=Methyloferula stellata TaxID=876270 RepID=UPI000374C27D|nr:trigger factor [Methyloferula stellata]